MKTSDRRREVHTATAVNLAAFCSCRSVLEDFAKKFIDKHRSYNDTCPPLCTRVLTMHEMQCSIFGHFEDCCGVASDKTASIEDESVHALKETDIKPPEGSLQEIYRHLSNFIRRSEWLRDEIGEVIIPYYLDPPVKRFLVRFLKANRMSVVVADVNGEVRDLFPEEVETPKKRQKV